MDRTNFYSMELKFLFKLIISQFIKSKCLFIRMSSKKVQKKISSHTNIQAMV